jgi:hypothetical protein
MLLLFLMSLFVFLGITFTLIAIPMIAGKIPPNPLYGFRTRATLNDPELWYRVNSYSGKWFFWSGIATILAAVFFFLLAITGLIPISEEIYTWLCLAVSVGCSMFGIQRSFAYMAKLRKNPG